MYKFEIKYYFGSYSGTRTIFAEDEETAVAKMWRELKPYMSLSMAYQSHEVLSCEEYDGD